MKARMMAMFGAAALVAVAGCARRAASPSGSPYETGAVTSVDAGQVNGGVVSLEELLRGKVAGVQFVPNEEGGTSIRIRGAMSLHEPLVLVDGIETGPRDLHTALAGLTRDDIRKVQVLKDVASTSMYGTKGVGGVIIITTGRR